jgi:hypothetical protein
MSSPLRPTAVAAVLYLAFAAIRLGAFDGDPSAFVVAGDGVTDVREAPTSLGVTLGVDGYDGQAYYRLARDPLTDEVDALGIAFRRPAYWQTRIGYPLASWAVSAGGREALVPAAMLAVGLASVVALALLAALLARDLGRSPWLGLVPALWAGYVVGVGQDLTEPLAGALLAAALLALRRGYAAPAAAALTAAALTRETVLVLAVAILVVAPLPRLRGSVPWWVGAVPVAAYAGWRTWVRARWADAVPAPPSDNPLGAPLVELGRYLARALADPLGHAGNLTLLVPTLAVLGVLALGLTDRDPATAHLRLALAAYLVLLACLPVWDRSQAYLRWACEPVVIGWLLALRAQRGRAVPVLAGLVAASWVAAVALTSAYPGTGTWVPADERTAVS